MLGSEVFSAGVQYNDFTGTVAADRSDSVALVGYLKDQGLANDNERVVGVRIVFNGNDGNEMPSPGVVVYLADVAEELSSPPLIRAVDVKISLAKLLSYYKRFDLVMTLKGEGFEAVEVDGPSY